MHVATQLLTRKVMRKCRGNEVPAPIVALVEQKDATKLCVTKFAQQRCNEQAVVEVRATREVAKAAAEQAKAAERVAATQAIGATVT